MIKNETGLKIKKEKVFKYLRKTGN